MRLTLNQHDIKKALIAHVATLGLNLSGRSVDVEFTAGRGVNGHSAVVIIDEDVVENDSKPAGKGVSGNPAGNVETVVEEEEVDLPPVTPETAVPASLFGE